MDLPEKPGSWHKKQLPGFDCDKVSAMYFLPCGGHLQLPIGVLVLMPPVLRIDAVKEKSPHEHELLLFVRDPDLYKAAGASSVDRCPPGCQGSSLRRAEVLNICLLGHIPPAVGPAHHSRAYIRHGVISGPVNGSLEIERLGDDVKSHLRIVLPDGDCPAVIIGPEEIGLLNLQFFLKSLLVGGCMVERQSEPRKGNLPQGRQ